MNKKGPSKEKEQSPEPKSKNETATQNIIDVKSKNKKDQKLTEEINKKNISDKKSNPEISESRKKNKEKVDEFQKYLSESGLPQAFELIFSELISKGIKQENYFSYTSMRLRQIGKEIEDMKNGSNS